MPSARRTQIQPVSAIVILAVALALLPSGAYGGDSEPPEEALLASILFHPDTPPGRVMIDLAPADSKRRMVWMLDTGASASVATPRMARAMGVSVRRTKNSPYRRQTILGRDLQFWVDTSSSDTASRTGWEYGLLGGDFLDDYVVEIDYPGRRVRFFDSSKYQVPEEVSAPNERVISFTPLSTRLAVDISVDGKTVRALLDTGAPGIALGGKDTRRVGLDVESLSPLVGMSGAFGPIESYFYETKTFSFAGFEFPGQPIAITPRGNYNQGAPSGSILGYDTLSKFTMRIDYDSKRLWLKRTDGDDELTFWGRRRDDVAANAPSHEEAPTLQEIKERDAERAAKFERDKLTRSYAETSGGGFVVVDGPRLRNGPREGETWYSYEEMIAIKAERKQAAEQ